MTATTDTDRRTAYAEVCKRFAINPKDPSTTAGEDAGLVLSGDEPCERYCVVTRNSDITYAYADDKSIEDAHTHAIRNVDDSIFAEIPVAIIDLHTGEERRPDWASLPWAIEREGGQ